ncbi:MAG: TIGR03790 family protein [Phycisphaerae bacterium]|nr:TIGR03790 family protein [Phycisphaerae bacterium]
MKTMKTINTILITIFIILTLSTRILALERGQIAIIANIDSGESLYLARYYCQQRGVPEVNIIAVSMPKTETIDRDTYNKIAKQIKIALQKPQIQGKIKCLLTTYHTPLRIANTLPSQDPLQLALISLNDKAIEESFPKLQKWIDSTKMLIEPGKTYNSTVEFPNRTVEYITLLERMLNNSQTAIQKFQLALNSGKLKLSTIDDATAKAIVEFGGLQNEVKIIQALYNSQIDPDQKSRFQKLFTDANNKIAEKGKLYNKLKAKGITIESATRMHELELELFGIFQFCGMRLNELKSNTIVETYAAFDSELSLILKDDYPLYRWQPNELCVSYGPGNIKPEPKNSNTMMVSRLDGPTALIAQGLIDKAIAAESRILNGKAYFDARGKYENINSLGTFGNYDQAIRDAAELVKNKTYLGTTLDDKESLFSTGQCPDTILYCGWYSLKNYIDSFTFVEGAIGYHIASWEATTLRTPNSNIWCPQLLNHGITATIGATYEPYLHAFPQPDKFFAELATGQHTLVECFYRTVPFTSWQMILIGDPLYKIRLPLKDKTEEPKISPITPPKTKPKAAPIINKPKQPTTKKTLPKINRPKKIRR